MTFGDFVFFIVVKYILVVCVFSFPAWIVFTVFIFFENAFLLYLHITYLNEEIASIDRTPNNDEDDC